MWTHLAPAAAKAFAVSSALLATWLTVENSPFFRRTHRPSFMSMAGNSIMR